VLYLRLGGQAGLISPEYPFGDIWTVTRSSGTSTIMITAVDEDAQAVKLAALNDYLGAVVQCVAWQLARNGDASPAFFVIPPPGDADQLEAAHDMLGDYMIFEFDNAPLPEIRYQGFPNTRQ